MVLRYESGVDRVRQEHRKTPPRSPPTTSDRRRFRAFRRDFVFENIFLRPSSSARGPLYTVKRKLINNCVAVPRPRSIVSEGRGFRASVRARTHTYTTIGNDGDDNGRYRREFSDGDLKFFFSVENQCIDYMCIIVQRPV